MVVVAEAEMFLVVLLARTRYSSPFLATLTNRFVAA